MFSVWVYYPSYIYRLGQQRRGVYNWATCCRDNWIDTACLGVGYLYTYLVSTSLHWLFGCLHLSTLLPTHTAPSSRPSTTRHRHSFQLLARDTDVSQD
jgi:hypothetical protein